MARYTLMCVGQEEGDSLPPSLQELVDTGVFDQQINAPDTAVASDRYWCDLLRTIPGSDNKVLVVSVKAEVTADLLRLGSLVTQQAVVVLPLSLQHEIARPLMKPSEVLALSVQEVNDWLNRYAVGTSLELPTIAGFCGWINVAAMMALDAESDVALAAALRQRGLSILLSDEAFVDDSACAEASAIEDLLPEPISAALIERHPYTALRHPLSELNKQHKSPPEILSRGPGVILHISHSWGGGLGRWISDFCAADDEHVHLVLRSVGTREASAQALALHLGAAPVPLKQWSLTTPIQSTSLGSYEYREILKEIQASFSVVGIVVSTLIGHSMDIYELPLPVMHVLHDYYPWCPPLYATWNNPCSACDGERLRQCLQKNPAHQFFGEEQAEWYLTLRRKFISRVTERNIPVVAPSESVKVRWQQLAPPLVNYCVRVVSHGLPDWELEAFRANRWVSNASEKLHLVVLGVLSEHKGGKTLERLMPELLERYRVTLLGAGEDAPYFAKHHGLTVVKTYQLPDLPKKLQTLKPDVGLLLSTVPETFSYTLSELFAAGIPPVATRMGAFEDRIEQGVTGWLVSPQGEDLLEVLAGLDGEREALMSVRARLLVEEQRSTLDMTKDYLSLLPTPSPIDAARPLCRSVVADLGVSLDEGEPSQKALFVRPAAAYRLALFQFLMYSYQKTQSSPQVSRVSRLILGLLLRTGMRLCRPRAQ